MTSRAQSVKKCMRMSNISQHLEHLRDKILSRHAELRKEKRCALLESRRSRHDRDDDEVPVDLDDEGLMSHEGCASSSQLPLSGIMQQICSELDLDTADDAMLQLLLDVEQHIADEELAAIGAPVDPDWEEYFLHLTVTT